MHTHSVRDLCAQSVGILCGVVRPLATLTPWVASPPQVHAMSGNQREKREIKRTLRFSFDDDESGAVNEGDAAASTAPSVARAGPASARPTKTRRHRSTPQAAARAGEPKGGRRLRPAARARSNPTADTGGGSAASTAAAHDEGKGRDP